MGKEIIKICEKHGWKVTIDGDTVTLEHQDAPYCFYVDIDDIDGAAYEEYQNFDEDDFITLWLEAKKNGVKGVPDIRGLLQAAEDIEDSLEALFIEDFSKFVCA